MSATTRLEVFDEPSTRKLVSIENISGHGARIRTEWHLRPHDRVIVSDLSNNIRVAAEVVYCHAARDGLFAIGVKFDEPTLRLTEAISTGLPEDGKH
jgi:hypothetical protein